jgi:hypothetical protein
MIFHPFKYQLSSTLLDKQERNSTIRVRRGSQEEILNFPNSLLPEELTIGESFTLKIEPTEGAHADESQILKNLLEELIR